MKRVRIIAGGVVQGVCFRYYAQRTADSIGVTGWIRNLPDGRIEAVIEGGDAEVDRMAAWFRHGPPGASVEEISAAVEPYAGEFRDFRVRA
ncbi:MAG: acylphosphatase [bacterium]|nr:acylphosphatase [bacterium]